MNSIKKWFLQLNYTKDTNTIKDKNQNPIDFNKDCAIIGFVPPVSYIPTL